MAEQPTGPGGTAVGDGGFRWPVQQFALDNGLRVVVCEDRTSPIAGVNLWYDVGSQHELPGKHGFAHLFEHLMFQGSAQVGKTEHFRVLQEVGGSAINATTSWDRTNYYQTVPSAALPTALWLEADRMSTLALTQDNLDNQRDVVKNERRQRYDNVPYGTWSEILVGLAYPEGHPYHHSVIGSMAELDGAEQSDFTRFYEAYYSPDNAVLTVVGDADLEQVRELAEEYFGGLPRRPRSSPAEVAELPASIDGPVREVLVEPVPLPRFFFGFRAARFGLPEAAAEEVLAAALGRGRGARLFTELVTRRRLAQAEGAYLGTWELARHASLMTGMVTPRPEADPAELEAAFFEVCENAAVEAPSEAELDRARSMLAADWARELSTVGSRADQLGRHATLFGDAGQVRDRLPQLLAVTAQDVRAAAERIFAPANRVVLEYRVAEPAAAGAGAPTIEGN